MVKPKVKNRLWVVERIEEGSRTFYDFKTIKEAMQFVKASVRKRIDISGIYSKEG